MDNNKVLVIGGGAAGMLAAATAGARGLDVTIVEKNNRVGKKLLITGKGRCNITNVADMETHISSVVHNREFLYSAFYTFDSHAVIQLFEKLGLKTKTERGGRVFPASDSAADVVNALKKHLKNNNVKVRYESPVKSIIKNNVEVIGIKLEDGTKIPCDKAILATGGKSYPGTGSTGDGYTMAKEVGHKIILPKPALTPFVAKEHWVKELQGLALKNTKLKLFKDDKLIFEDFGEMLFTHYGISGPMVLSASGHVKNIEKCGYKVVLDLKPALDEKTLDQRIQKDFEKYSRKNFSNSLDELLPKKMIPVIIELSKIPADKSVNQISKAERIKLGGIMKNLTITPISLRGFEEAIVTAGGVDVKEIDPSTMESKLVKGLFFAGEVMDLDAYTGGFNLQIAFSTGYLAGSSC